MASETPDSRPSVGSPPESPQESAPLVLIPVTAEDVFRRKVRIVSWIAFGVILAVAVTLILWKRSTDPIEADQAFDAGQRFLKVARYHEAALSFDRAVRLRPGLVEAYFLRGRAYLGLGETDRAIGDFTRVIELAPTNADAYKERGGVYFGLKDYMSAIRDLGRAIELNPQYSEAFNLRGMAWREQGDLQRALADLDTAVRISSNPDNHFQRGATLQLMGEHRRAIADFDVVIGFKPDIAHAYFARARSRTIVGDESGAKSDHKMGRHLDGR